MLKKQIERVCYVLLIFSLNVGYLFATILAFFSFLILKSGKKDVLLFPYYPKNNPGSVIRFQNYLEFFQKDDITFDICYTSNNKDILNIVLATNSRINQYLLYLKIFWKRIFQVLKARNYKAVFIQRGLFPYYPDQRSPHLEKLLRKINNNITIDFYDADYISDKELVDKSVKYCNKVTVVNSHLYNYFNQLHFRVFEFPLALDPTSYMVKKNYSLNNPIKIIWSGSYENAKKIKKIFPVLKHLSDNYSIELILICPEKPILGNIKTKHYQWDANTFFKLMQSADIAIYTASGESEIDKGKMALKVLEYMATALPIVASPWGIPSTLIDEYSILISDNINEWEINLIKLFKDQELREKIGQKANQIFHKHHTIENSYKQLKSILFN